MPRRKIDVEQYPECIRCHSTDILDRPTFYRCNDCGNKSLKNPKKYIEALKDIRDVLKEFV